MSSIEEMTDREMVEEADHNLAEVARRDADDRARLIAAREEIKSTNTFSLLFNPMEKTSPVLFRRGQMIIWLARLLAFVIGIGLMMAGVKYFPLEVPGGRGGTQDMGPLITFLINFFAVIVVTSFSTIAQHVARLDHAGRPTILGLIAALPVLILVGFTLQEAQKGAKFVENMRLMQQAAANFERMGMGGQGQDQRPGRPPAEDSAAPDASDATAGEEASDGETTETEATSDDASTSTAEQPARAGGQRGGPPRGGPGGRGGGGGLGFVFENIFNLPRILMSWFLALFVSVIFTWAYVARVQRKPHKQ